MGSAIHGSAQKKTNQWSREFPLFALSSSDLKQEVHRLVIQPAAKAPPSKKRVHTRLPTPPPRIGPSSSHSSHEAPPPPPGPPPPINNQIHQYSGACVTSTSSPPPLAIVPMIPMTNDCSWHRTCDWAGQPFPSMHNGFITYENVITTEHRLLSVLTSLQDKLFFADNKGYNFFYSVVARRFKFGHVHVSYMATTGKYIGMELACKCCCRYVCVEFNSKWGTFTELQEVRATLLSFISGCEYTRPGSDALPQR